MKILLIEDDSVIGEQLRRALENERYRVEWAQDGAEGFAQAVSCEPDAILLDVMLPKMDGWTVLAELRRRKVAAPVLMLTARDAVEDRVKGLENGADDYLAKPFDIRELLARVKALLRRDKLNKTGLISIADLEIDTEGRRVTRGGASIDLTPREFDLLEALARNEGRTLTRAVILERVWGAEESLENTVNFHVASLRKKVDEGFEPKLIQTVHGIGYSLRTP